MKKITVFAFLLLFIPAISGALPSQKAYSQFSVLPFKQKANGDYLSIRPSFIENKGQQDKDILYYVNTSTYQIGFGVNAIYLNIPQNTTTNCITKKNSIKGHCVVISFHDANVCTPKGQDPHLQKSNFFQGNDCSQWHKGVSHYSSIVYENVYNHIDFVFCINENRLFWQYNVKPGARMQDIDFRVQGGTLVKNGNTFIFSYHQKELLRQYFHVPQKSSLNESFHYQSVLVSENQYGFDVIDGYSSLSQTASIIQSEMISSSNSPLFYRYWTIGIVTDTNECAYICGYTWIYCIHTKPGGYSVNEDYDIFVFSLDSTGSSIRYSTFIGGSNTDKSSGIAIDADNNVYVCGYTDSSNFPTTKDSYDTTYNNRFDVYVFKLDSTGSELLYSTYIGGDHVDIADCICIDDANNAYICGWTYSTIFPVTSTKYDSHPLVLHNYVLKLNHQGANIEYSMYIGGSEIVCFRKNAVDAAGYLYVCGWTEAHDFYTTPNAYNTTINGSLDCFVFAVNPEGDGLQYSTFVGGNECGEKWEWDVAEDICIDSSGNVYVCGFTNSLDFPTTIDSLDTTYNGQKDGFILVLNAELEQLIYSTYIGGSKNDYIKRMEIDADGNAFVCGWTGSSDFPTTPNAYDTTYNGCIDCFVFALNPFENVMLYSTFVGGGSEDICLDFTLDKKGNTYVCGYTNSSDFPTSKDAYDPTYNGQEDCFVFALTPDGSNLIYSTFIVLEGY